MSDRIIELFGKLASSKQDWGTVVADQLCPYSGSRCFKVRKSASETSIGTCVVAFGKDRNPLVICPNKFLDRRVVFSDCLPMLKHRAGNDLHIIAEVAVPGGSVDYFLVTARNGDPEDFVGIEFQALDTTGSVWPARQSFLKVNGVEGISDNPRGTNPGVNWKMTAKTILVQLHHKVETFEALGKSFVLVLQHELMDYMEREFNFGHLSAPATSKDSMFFHPYSLGESMALKLMDIKSTNVAGIAAALNLGASAKMKPEELIAKLKRKLSHETIWNPV